MNIFTALLALQSALITSRRRPAATHLELKPSQQDINRMMAEEPAQTLAYYSVIFGLGAAMTYALHLYVNGVL